MNLIYDFQNYLIDFNIILYLCSCFSSGVLASGFPTKLNALLISPIRPTCLVFIYDEKYKLWNASLRNILQRPFCLLSSLPYFHSCLLPSFLTKLISVTVYLHHSFISICLIRFPLHAVYKNIPRIR